MKAAVCHINLASGFRGGERQTLLLVEALAGKIKQTVVLRRGVPLVKLLSGMEGVEVIEVGKPFFAMLPRLKSFPLIHAHEAKAVHIAYMAKILYGIPYVVTRRVIKRPKNNYFFRKTHVNASRVVAISNQIRKGLKKIDDRIQSQVIFSSFSSPENDPNVTADLRQKYGNKFLIGHVGALVNKDKGQAHIINVARKLHGKYPEIHFLFLGEGRDRGAFEAQAQGCPNIEFAGFKSNIGDYYSIFDLFLFPSLDEGLGSSVLDAFYFSLPVIATEVGGIPDMIESGKNGILIPSGDEGQMEAALLRLYKDSNLRENLGKAANASLYRFDIQRAAGQYEKLYQSLLKQTK